MTQRLPHWCTPERQRHLVALFQRSGGFCIYGHRPCPYDDHHYQVFMEGLIGEWKADDRQADAAAWQAERQRLHAMPEKGKPRSHFDYVARERFYLRQPPYYLEGIGFDPLAGQPVAQVRIASTIVRLFVRLPHGVVKLRMGRRRTVIDRFCTLAVKDWMKQKQML